MLTTLGMAVTVAENKALNTDFRMKLTFLRNSYAMERRALSLLHSCKALHAVPTDFW